MFCQSFEQKIGLAFDTIISSWYRKLTIKAANCSLTSECDYVAFWVGTR